jgi:23S rRNA (guanosine2251-2'-O)-methyltransferase
MRKLKMDDLNRISVEEFRASKKIPIIIVLENIRSMHNVGSVFRTADAFLLAGVYLCGYTPCPPHRDIQKTALGATDSVSWKYFQHSTTAIETLKEDGFRIIAVEQVEGSTPLQQVTRNEKENAKLAVILGNEVTGVDERVLSLCDEYIEIPQLGSKHSLNIAVAAGIVLWELVRGKI